MQNLNKIKLAPGCKERLKSYFLKRELLKYLQHMIPSAVRKNNTTLEKSSIVSMINLQEKFS